MTRSVVVGTDPRQVLKALSAFHANLRVSSRLCPYCKGDAGERIAKALKDAL